VENIAKLRQEKARLVEVMESFMEEKVTVFSGSSVEFNIDSTIFDQPTRELLKHYVVGLLKHYEEPVEKAERYIQTTTRFYEILGKRRMM
jgi:hypothetical protein